ncbi:hypothetical protein MMMB2_1520 [Mycobacterium marinum MB2]|nr:hypothetical protein MMMB2_1520 [Mycobacterium marinum MB2]
MREARPLTHTLLATAAVLARLGELPELAIQSTMSIGSTH